MASERVPVQWVYVVESESQKKMKLKVTGISDEDLDWLRKAEGSRTFMMDLSNVSEQVERVRRGAKSKALKLSFVWDRCRSCGEYKNVCRCS